jgi:hypothetical protein
MPGLVLNTRYHVEGMYFNSLQHLFKYGQSKGYTGSRSALWKRLNARPGITMKELFAPPSRNGMAGGLAHKAKIERERAEMAALIAEMDARKKK